MSFYTLAGCSGVAALFHGEKPAPPPEHFTVSFDANGAQGAAPPLLTANAGAAITLPYKETMRYEGKEFCGWSENSESVLINGVLLPGGGSFTVYKTLILYAQWIDGATPRYTVSFDANGASGTSPEAKICYGGLSVSLPDAGPLVLSGTIFDGWNTNTVGTGTRHTAASAYKVTADVTLYAAWRRSAGDTNGALALSVWKDEDDNSITFGDWRALTNGSFWKVNDNGTIVDYNGKTLESEYRTANNTVVIWTNKSINKGFQLTFANSALTINTSGGGVRSFYKETSNP